MALSPVGLQRRSQPQLTRGLQPDETLNQNIQLPGLLTYRNCEIISMCCFVIKFVVISLQQKQSNAGHSFLCNIALAEM